MDDFIIKHSEFFRRMVNLYVQETPDEKLAEQPAGLPNHAAWVVGHLVGVHDFFRSLVDPGHELDAAWREKYGGGSTPVTDRSAYPSKEELLKKFNDSAAETLAFVESLDDAALNATINDERIGAFFPTVGQFAVHVLVAERAFHVGQLSAWRRALGLEAVFSKPEAAQALVPG